MGDNEERAQPLSGLFPNGVDPDEAATLIQVLDVEQLAKAEEIIARLIARIQPNTPSEKHRTAVADYVKRVIMKCFPGEVFTYGSMPLKTYLADGDIDLTTFTNNPNPNPNVTWAKQVHDFLKIEQENESAEFRIKEVHLVPAEHVENAFQKT